jgi:hypothetical protein
MTSGIFKIVFLYADKTNVLSAVILYHLLPERNKSLSLLFMQDFNR